MIRAEDHLTAANGPPARRVVFAASRFARRPLRVVSHHQIKEHASESGIARSGCMLVGAAGTSCDLRDDPGFQGS